MKAGTKKDFACLCSVAVVMVLGNSMIVPLLPVIRKTLNISLVQAGLLITSFSVAAGLTIPIAGFLSDRYGRKNVIVPSLLLYGLAGVATGIMPLIFRQAALTPMLVTRAIQGIGAGGTYQIAMALTGDMFHTKERRAALGYLEASNGGGKVAAPIVGSALGMISWMAPFYLYGVASLPVAAAVWKGVPEPEITKASKGLKDYFMMISSLIRKKASSIASCFAGGLFVLFLYFGVLSVLSDVLEAERGLTGVMLGLVIAIPVGAMATTSFFGGRWLTTKDTKTLRLAAAGGMLTAGVGLLGAFLAPNPVLLVAAVFVMSIGNGLVLPSLNSLITGAAPAEERGLLTSLYGTTRHVGAASGPPLFGLAFGRFGSGVYAIAAGIAVSTALALYFLVHEEVMLEEPEGEGETKARPRRHPRPEIA